MDTYPLTDFVSEQSQTISEAIMQSHNTGLTRQQQ